MDTPMWGDSSYGNWSESDHISGFELKETYLGHGTELNTPLAPNGPDSRSSGPFSSKNLEADSAVENDFSDSILKYINQVLMEDDTEDKISMIQDSALHAAKKSFHDVLAEEQSFNPNQFLSNGNINSSNYMGICSCTDYCSNKCLIADNLTNSGLSCSLSDYKLHAENSFADHSFLSDSSSVCPPSSSCDTVNGSMGSTVDVPTGLVVTYSEKFPAYDSRQIRTVLQLKEEIGAPKECLASGSCGNVHLDNVHLCPPGSREKVVEADDKSEVDDNLPSDCVRGRKHMDPELNEYEEGRNKKRTVASTTESLLVEMLHVLMLCDGENDEPASRPHDKSPQNEGSMEAVQDYQSNISNGGKRSYKKRGSKKEMVDTRALLSQCVQAMASDDLRSANELLRQIRWHSSPFGDKFQRMSHYFANSFDARLAGTGHVLYTLIRAKIRSNINSLKASKHFVSAFPFMKISYFFSTEMIMDQAAKASRLHIINFDILHGLHWPPLIQRLSKRAGGPPKLRITGIENPEPGFQPAAMIEQTGRRLSYYCESLGVPFEYNCIAKKFQNIQVEDLKIEKDETLVVAAFYTLKYLHDESISEDNPRDAVLNLVKRTSPDIFVHAIENGAYNSPFLVSRFREASLHFSAVFDMFEANFPREAPERMLLEQEVYGRAILNVIACEGLERVERPESYKQWHVRHVRAGFCQLPLNREIMNKATAITKSSYHKDFLVDENNQWFLQGWKGRVLFALSFWKPA